MSGKAAMRLAAPFSRASTAAAFARAHSFARARRQGLPLWWGEGSSLLAASAARRGAGARAWARDRHYRGRSWEHGGWGGGTARLYLVVLPGAAAALALGLHSRGAGPALAQADLRAAPVLIDAATGSAKVHGSGALVTEDAGWGAWRVATCAVRLARHALVFIPLAMAFLPMHLSGLREAWWSWALAMIQRSGPAFVKFAQWAATRTDVFPQELCSKLSLLQSQAKEHTLIESERQVESAFGGQLPASLIELEAAPVGSGCIAQVHRGKLRREGGGEAIEVAVKVLHPGVRDRIERDLDVMRVASAAVELVPYFRWLALRESVEEFAGIMQQQLDLRIEADNLDHFEANFKGHDEVSFPRPIRPFVSRDVLVESFEQGVPIAQYLAGDDVGLKRKLARIGVNAFLKMCFKDNFVHGDLHPGNILVAEPRGRQPLKLIFLDAGITTELSRKDQANFVSLFSAIVKGDGHLAGRLMIDNAREHRCRDPEAFCEGMRRLVDEALGAKLKLEKVKAGEILARAFALACDHRVKVESNFATICIAIMVLEGLGRNLDPHLDILNAALPVLAAKSIGSLVSSG